PCSHGLPSSGKPDHQEECGCRPCLHISHRFTVAPGGVADRMLRASGVDQSSGVVAGGSMGWDPRSRVPCFAGHPLRLLTLALPGEGYLSPASVWVTSPSSRIG